MVNEVFQELPNNGRI